MHRIFYFPDLDDPLTAGARALCYSNFHGCFFAQAGDLDRARQHLDQGGTTATIFHLTGDERIFHGASDANAVQQRCQKFLNRLQAFIVAGGRFVWTVESCAHRSLMADEQMMALRKALGALAHLIHCTSFATAKAVQTFLNLDWRKLTVVPPGNYHPLTGFERAVNRPLGEQAGSVRERLGLEPGHRLFGHLATSHPAGGTERLFSYWQRTKPENTALLLLADGMAEKGRPDIATLRAAGIHVMEEARTVAALAREIADVDLVVLPHREALGVAELMLALSSGRPLLIPALPTFLELITPGQEALTYDPEAGEEAFAACMDHALSLDRAAYQAMSEHAKRRALAMSWRMLGRQLADGFLRVAAGGLPVLPALEPAAIAPGAIKPRQLPDRKVDA